MTYRFTNISKHKDLLTIRRWHLLKGHSCGRVVLPCPGGLFWFPNPLAAPADYLQTCWGRPQGPCYVGSAQSFWHHGAPSGSCALHSCCWWTSGTLPIVTNYSHQKLSSVGLLINPLNDLVLQYFTLDKNSTVTARYPHQWKSPTKGSWFNKHIICACTYLFVCLYSHSCCATQ